MRSAFTLVELLVVISIVGILSSIAVAATSSARDKAAIAAGLQFESSVQHAVGSETVASWDFDEGSGATASDSSGSGRNVSLSGGAGWVCASADKKFTPSGEGCALNLDGTGYITTGMGGLNDGTVTLWFNKRNTAAANNLIGKRTPGCYSSAVYLNTPGNEVKVYNAGPEAVIGYIQYNKWNHLAVVRSGGGTKADYYLNGKLSLSNAYNLNLNDLISTIGASCAGSGAPLVGYMDSVRVYGAALGASRIKNLYAEEKARFDKLGMAAANP